MKVFQGLVPTLFVRDFHILKINPFDYEYKKNIGLKLINIIFKTRNRTYF